MQITLKGIAKVTAKGSTYYYAWRGGPRLVGMPGSPEFIASYNEAVAGRQAPDTSRFRGIVTSYKASHDWQKLSTVTQKSWTRWLDRIADHFGDLRVAQFDRTDQIRAEIRQWRYQWAATPRYADLGMQVLSRLCSFAIDPLGKLKTNPCTGIKRVYEGGDRADIIWQDDDITALKLVAGAELCHAIDLAAHTGLRAGDLVRVSWSHVRTDVIVLPTGKSRGRREAVIPIHDRLRDILAAIPRRATTILANTEGRPWTTAGLDTSFRRAKAKSMAADKDLHWHDLRGTCATKLYLADVPVRAIAEIVGWEEDEVSRIIRKYVSGSAAVRDVVRAIEARRKG